VEPSPGYSDLLRPIFVLKGNVEFTEQLAYTPPLFAFSSLLKSITHNSGIMAAFNLTCLFENGDVLKMTGGALVVG
jgi:hypothetical protein